MRLFLGTLLSPANQRFYRGLSDAVVSRHRGVLRAIPPESAHVTYLFSADAREDCLAALEAEVRRVAVSCPEFAVELGPPHVLLAGSRPRLICADVVTGTSRVTSIVEQLLQAVQQAELPLSVSATKEPHVTLVRFSKHARRTDARAVSQTLESGRWAKAIRTDRISSVQIIASTLGPSGPVYEVRSNCLLKSG